ncbi:MAG TPA: protein kinase [Gemmatimonadales bacterium]|nr:protein kinase [Gemmatimonadales bacterium]
MSASRVPPLTPADWEQIRGWFDHATSLPPADRQAWVGSLIAPPHLLATVRQMLAADAADGGLLDAGVAPAAHLVLEPEAILPPGTAVGAFDIIGELDRGGMGIVYAARDRHLDRAVALKFVRARVGSDRTEAERVLAEAKAASALDHPNVATIYQVGESSDGRYFIAMPRYDGESLRARLERGPLPLQEALAIARAVASGLAAAHRVGMVHRDVTAGNIFLTVDGSVKLLDFGIAALASGSDEASAARGTLPYMSPEQLNGDAIDARADVWSLGVVLYRMLTGELPFAGLTETDVVAAIRDSRPAPTLAGREGIPRWLVRVVERALRKDRVQRFTDAAALLAALEQKPPSWRARRMAGVAAGLFALLGWGAVVLRPPAPEGEMPASVLMLDPLITANSDSGVAATAAAMVDEVATRLAAVGVQVVRVSDASRIHSTPTRGRPHLEVSIRMAGGTHSLAATVRDVDGSHALWDEPRALVPGGLRALSGELTAGVLRVLGIVLSPRDHASLARGLPSTVEAYEALIRGNTLLARRTPEALWHAMARYEEARRLDPGYVSAYARGAYAVALLADWGWNHPMLSRRELLDQGRALGDSALALDSLSAEAWLARAYLLAVADPERLRGAPEAFRRAIALDPYNAEAYYQYGQTSMVLGRFSEAATAYRRALELRPGDAMSLISMAGLADLGGRRSESFTLADSALAVAPDMAYARVIEALVLAYRGKFPESEREARRALSLDSTFTVPALSVLSMARAGQGDSIGAVALIAQARLAQADEAPSPDEAHMLVHAQLAAGRHADAVRTVQSARPRGAGLWYLFQMSYFREFRRDSAVAAVLATADPRN